MSSYVFALASPDTIRITKELGPWPEDRRHALHEFETYAISLRNGEPAYCYCPASHGHCKHLGWAKEWLAAGADPLRYICDGVWSALPSLHPDFVALLGWNEAQVLAYGGGAVTPGQTIAASESARLAELPTLTLEDLEL